MRSAGQSGALSFRLIGPFLLRVRSLQIMLVSKQGRSQEFATETKERVCGTEVPQRGPGAEHRWESGGKAPAEAGDKR